MCPSPSIWLHTLIVGTTQLITGRPGFESCQSPELFRFLFCNYLDCSSPARIIVYLDFQPQFKINLHNFNGMIRFIFMNDETKQNFVAFYSIIIFMLIISLLTNRTSHYILWISGKLSKVCIVKCLRKFRAYGQKYNLDLK